MRRIICVILISAFVLASASFSFADGFTTAQASNITQELTSNSTAYIKGIIAGILKAITGSSTYSGSDSVFAKLQNIVNAVAANNGGGLLQKFNEAFTGSYNGSSTNPLRGSVLGRLAAIDKALYGSHNLEGSDYQGIGWYLYDIDSKLGGSADISLSAPQLPILIYHRNTPDSELVTYQTTLNNLPLVLNSGSSDGRLYFASNPAKPETLGDWFSVLNTNMVQSTFRLFGRHTLYQSTVFDPENFTTLKYNAASVMDVLDLNLGDIVKSVGRLSYFLVDEDELQAKKDNKDIIEGAVQGFLSPGESASLSGSNVLQFKGSFDSIQNGFESSASASDSFSVLSSGSETYSWFTQSTADDLDSVGSGSTLRALGSDTPALDQYYQDVLFGIHFFD